MPTSRSPLPPPCWHHDDGDPIAGRERRPRRSPRTSRPPLWTLGLGLVAVHLVVTLLVRPYPRWNDGIFVLNDARSFPDVPLDHHALRIGNLLPTRLFLDLFGYGQVAYYAWPFVTGILLILATFALGNVLFGRWVGAAAALLMVFHPVLVDTEIRPGVERMTSWQLLPDIPSAAFLTLGFALMIGAAQRRSARRRAATAGRRGGTSWRACASAGPTWCASSRCSSSRSSSGSSSRGGCPFAGGCRSRCRCSPAWPWSWSWPSPSTATRWPACTSASSTAGCRGPSCPGRTPCCGCRGRSSPTRRPPSCWPASCSPSSAPCSCDGGGTC